MTPSDFRFPAGDFAFDLYAEPCPDLGWEDGPLLFRTSPCTRATVPTPRRLDARFGSGAPSVVFAVT